VNLWWEMRSASCSVYICILETNQMLRRSKKCVYNKAANGQKTTKKGSGDITYNGGIFFGSFG